MKPELDPNRVTTVPGWNEYAVMPVPMCLSASSLMKRIVAILDVPYARLEARHEQAREQERREVVLLDRSLVPVDRHGPLGVEAARVVDEHVDPVVSAQQRVGEGAHVVEVVVVGHEGLAPDRPGDGTGAFRVAPHDREPHTVLGRQRLGRRLADTRARAREDDGASGAAHT
jgi:hypothetical protein